MVTRIASVIVLLGVYITAIGGLFFGSLTVFCLGLVAWLMDITNLFTYIPKVKGNKKTKKPKICLLYTSPSPRDKRQSRMPSSA